MSSPRRAQPEARHCLGIPQRMRETRGMSMPASARARRSRVRLSSAQRREQLLTIAREVFAERGFEGTSVEEIAARAGVSKPVVYEHFGGKDGAYQAVVEKETTTCTPRSTPPSPGQVQARGKPWSAAPWLSWTTSTAAPTGSASSHGIPRSQTPPALSPPSSARSPPRSRTSCAPSSPASDTTRNTRTCMPRPWSGWWP